WKRRRILDPELDIFSRHPNFIATASNLLSVVRTQLVFFDPPTTDSLLAHFLARQLSIRSVDFAPVHFIVKFHAGELCADFGARYFFESVLGNRTDLVSNEGVNCESDESCEFFHYRLSLHTVLDGIFIRYFCLQCFTQMSYSLLQAPCEWAFRHSRW